MEPHVYRGGAYNMPAETCTSAFRSQILPGRHWRAMGFRPVFTLTEDE